MSDAIRINRAMLAILLFVATQAIAGIVWGATMTSRIAYMSSQVDKVEAALTASASKDKELMTALVSANGRRLDAIEKRIERMEDHP